jgi:DNA polymerase V
MKNNVFSLVDANNFYASCERVFNASVQSKPIVVLSNNDGCVVARSNDIKQYVKMGQPVFEIEDVIQAHDVQVFSSNYSLYAGLSARVMAVLSEFSPLQEIYSIDESFLELTHFLIDDFTECGHSIKARVFQCTSIPVSVSFAATKCLSKIGVEIVKHDPSYEGVLDLTGLSEQALDELLATVAIEDVWGVGSKYARFLRSFGIDTAKALKYADETWIRKYLTVTGARIVLELRGISCIPIELDRPPKQGIMCSRTFGREITSREEMGAALANYAARAAEKLREQDSLASCLTIFIRTNSFRKDTPQYSNSYTLNFPYPTAFTPNLIRYALDGLKRIYQDGYRYKKAGVYLTKITPQHALQPDLFGEFTLAEQYKQARLMLIVDLLNRIYGRDTLFFAREGITRGWSMQRHKLSQRFTTQWSEILTI